VVSRSGGRDTGSSHGSVAEFTDQHGGEAGIDIGGVEVLEGETSVASAVGVADGAVSHYQGGLLGGGHQVGGLDAGGGGE